MNAVQKAEDKLRQNDQQVEIFEALRQTIKTAKPVKTKPIGKEEKGQSDNAEPKKRGRPFGAKKKKKESSSEESEEHEAEEQEELEEELPEQAPVA